MISAFAFVLRMTPLDSCFHCRFVVVDVLVEVKAFLTHVMVLHLVVAASAYWAQRL